MAHRTTGRPEDFEPASGIRGASAVRYRVLALAVAMGAITYLDRVCIAQMEPDIRRDLGLTDPEQWGYILSSFTLAYAAFEIPSGAWGDRIGTRRVLTRIVVWWSSFTIATAASVGYRSLQAVRFLFGMGEAGAFPNVSRAFSRWFPASERGTAQGIFFAGTHLGGGLTPLLVAALLKIPGMTWRGVFVVFGTIGFLWALVWYRWFRDDPAEHAEVGAAEWALIETGRRQEAPHRFNLAVLARVLTDRNMIALCLMYFTQAYGFYFNITWLPKYLREIRGFSSWLLGLMAGLPLITSAAADLVGGLTTDRLARAYGLRVGRCAVGGASLLVASLSLIAATMTGAPLVAALLIALAGGAVSFLLGAAWGTCIDISGTHAGLVTATMNTAGQVGAIISPLVFPRFIKQTPPDWHTPLLIMGGLYLVGALCWLFVDPTRPIRGLGPEPAHAHDNFSPSGTSGRP
jgi:MFS family permease